MPAEGDLLADRYRLENRLGAGGMGEVWRAVDEALGRTVAVKLVHTWLTADPGFSRRFHAEARAMASIDHPAVVTVHDFRADAAAFLVMEYIDGEPLSHRLQAVGRLPVADTLDLLAQAGDALQAAHDRGIIHRDVKPANLLIRTDGRVVLTDFGLARTDEASLLTTTGVVLGTLSYLSPEQVLGDPATARSDIYALGLVGYECVAGTVPFPRQNPFASAMARTQEPPSPLPQEVPPSVRRLLERALARDPDHRFESAAALAAASRKASPHAFISADVPASADAPAAPPAGPAARRRWLAATGISLATVMFTAAALWVAALIWDGPDGDSRTSRFAQQTKESGDASQPDAEEPAGSNATDCEWLPRRDDSGYTQEVGTPDPLPLPTGPVILTIVTSHGDITVEMEAQAAPCTYLSLRHLGETGFYEGSVCHRLTTDQIFILQCGDPSGTGAGEPTYRFAEENLPVEKDPTYPSWVVAMASAAGPASTGGQFFFVYGDSDLPPHHTVIGTVTTGMEIVFQVASEGHDGSAGSGDGYPHEELAIESLRVEP